MFDKLPWLTTAKPITFQTTATNREQSLCVVPWIHLNIEPDGRMTPCCLTSTKVKNLGNINETSIEEVWNSEVLRTMRTQMLNGKRPEICSRCWKQEEVTGESSRIHRNREFGHVVERIPDMTEPDGTVKDMKLLYWDFRFSNICNLKCRSCGPQYSSAWKPDAEALGWIKPNEIGKVIQVDSVSDKTNFDFIVEQSKYVERIYFAGGEPLLMDEHWQILDLLEQQDRFDVTITYNTNCSSLTHKGKNVLDYWRKWKKGHIEIWPSIDEIGPRAELIRSGSDWNKIERNLIAMSELDNLIVRPNITVGALNAHRIPEIVEHLTSIGVINSKQHYHNWYINLILEPDNLHVSIWNETFRMQTIDKLTAWAAEYEKKYRTMRILPKLNQIIHELRQPTNQGAKNRFLQLTKQMDVLRQEDTYATIPELVEALK